MSMLGPLSVYAVATAQIGGSTLYTIKWTGLEPNEEGWSPRSVTAGQAAFPDAIRCPGADGFEAACN